MTHCSVLFIIYCSSSEYFWQHDMFMSNLIYLVQWQGKNCLCVCHNDHQLFGIGYHFKIFRSQVASGKKVNFTPCTNKEGKENDQNDDMLLILKSPWVGVKLNFLIRLWWIILSLIETKPWVLRRNLNQPMTFCKYNNIIK